MRFIKARFKGGGDAMGISSKATSTEQLGMGRGLISEPLDMVSEDCGTWGVPKKGP